MNIKLKSAIILTILIAVSWILGDKFDSRFLILSVTSAVVSIFLWIIIFIGFIMKKINKPPISPYKMFAVMDIILITILGIWSVYDIATDIGFLPGLGGVMGLVIGEPILAGLFLIDFIVYKINMKKQNNNCHKTDN